MNHEPESEVSVCCPNLIIAKCEDTSEHRHPVCGIAECPVGINVATIHCVSNHNWLDCPIWIRVIGDIVVKWGRN